MSFADLLLLIVFPVGPLLLASRAWFRCRGAPPAASTVPLWPGILNASLALALGFNIAYFVQEWFLAWPKSLLPGVDATVYHNNHGWSGDHPYVMIFQGTGALAAVMLGFVLTGLGYVLRKKLLRWHPLWWWVACMATGLGLVQIVVAAGHPDNDVGQAMDALGLTAGQRNLAAAIAALGAIGFGVHFVRPLLAMAPYRVFDGPRSRVAYVLKFGGLPLLFGPVIAIANRAPGMDQLTMPLLAGLFILPWTLASAALTATPNSATTRLNERVDWALVVASIAVFLLYRLVLADGLAI